MSITDELRKWGYGFCGDTRDVVTAIADRIDAKYEEACREQYNRGYNDGFDKGFASADDWLAQHEDAMAEHGWVRKNKEHVISHATVEVTPHIDWSRMADELDEFVKIVRGMAGGASDKIHHHEPTVEGLLWEFGQGWHEQMNGPETFDVTDYVERYAAKLRLADDGEER